MSLCLVWFQASTSLTSKAEWVRPSRERGQAHGLGEEGSTCPGGRMPRRCFLLAVHVAFFDDCLLSLTGKRCPAKLLLRWLPEPCGFTVLPSSCGCCQDAGECPPVLGFTSGLRGGAEKTAQLFQEPGIRDSHLMGSFVLMLALRSEVTVQGEPSR